MLPSLLAEGMKVRIISGDKDHPLLGHLATVYRVTPPLPTGSGIPLTPAELAEFVNSLPDGSEHAQRGFFFHPDAWELPFAFSQGRVLLFLGEREEGRRWNWPYVTVSPDDVERVADPECPGSGRPWLNEIDCPWCELTYSHICHQAMIRNGPAAMPAPRVVPSHPAGEPLTTTDLLSHKPDGCPDGGTCGHWCGPGSCFRVTCCGPLSGVYPGDTWPTEVREANPRSS